MFKRYTSLLFPLLMTLLALALIVSQRTTTADAATITVNSTADVVADDGQCTLREAITAANTDSTSGTMAGECPPGSGDDTIMLSTESYTLTITGADEDSNATGDLDLTSDITIEVADGTATLDGNQLDRVLHVHDGATVSLSDLTITGGKTADGIDGGQAGQPGGDADHGGGIYNAGILTLIDVTLRNNRTGRGGFGRDFWFRGFRGHGGHAGQGGAIYNAESGDITISNSIIIDNMTGSGGHGASVKNLFGFPGFRGGDGGAGGGIFNDGMASLTNSMVSHNLAGGAGAGGHVYGSGAGEGGKSGSGGAIANLGMMMLADNTISDNTTGNGQIGSPGGNGGGITNSGRLILNNDFVSENRTGNGADGGFEVGSPSSGGFGGGIHNTGLLTMTSSVITGNLTGDGGHNDISLGANGGFGGGLYNEGSMSIADSTISHNQTGNGGIGTEQGGSGGDGGGLHNAGTGFLTVTNSTISHNITGNGGDTPYDYITNLRSTSHLNQLDSKSGFQECDPLSFSYDCGGDGGGIYHAGEGMVTLIKSTVSNNITGNGGNVLEYTGQGGRAGDGRGIAHKGNGELILLTSTISGNRTGDGGNGNGDEDGGRGGNGGGLFTTSSLTISHTTIANNSTGSGGQGGEGGANGANGDGGGIANLDEGNTTLRNTILADNSSRGNGSDCIGTLSSSGYNLIQETTDCQLTGDMTGNLTDISATLAPLADYGGRTFTHALLSNHPALDAGSCRQQSMDQRHRPRPVDVPILPNADDGCDMGAYEAQFRDAYLIKSVDDATPSAGQLITYTITVSNIGATAITGAIISDTLPTGLTFAAPVTLSPPQAGAILAQQVADLPTLASNLTITAGSRITLTFPVTVNIGLEPGTSLTNIASVTSSEVPTPTIGAVTIRLPAPDLRLKQSLIRNGPFDEALPGEPITYSLAFSNIGDALATGVVLTDILSETMSNVSIISTGAPITDTGATPPYMWQVADLAPGAGGMITITGVISPELESDLIISHIATITGSHDIDQTNNQEQINLIVELPQVRFNNNTYSVPENGSTANILIRLNRENPYREVTVDYTAQNGTATVGEDYGIIGDSSPPNGTLTIKNGTTIMLTMPILDDNIKEGHETVFLNLSNPRGATLGFRDRATLTILDDETPPTPTPTLTPTANFATNTPIPSTPTVTPTSTIIPDGAIEPLYLPLLFKK